MRLARIGLLLVLLDFVALTLWALATGGGLRGLIELHTASPWAIQIFCDLVISLAIVSVFVWRDARARGANPWPWLVATLFLGSIAPLTYFVVRPGAAAAPLREPAVRTA